MSKLSKLLTCSCYELGHTWEPSCRKAVAEIAQHGYKQAFKIYLPLYLMTAIIRKRKKKYYLQRLPPELLRSTLFLGTNAFSFIAFFCLWRRVMGGFKPYHFYICSFPILASIFSIEHKSRKFMGRITLLSSAFLPSMCASFCAIILERDHRRVMLAVYMMNVAMETVWRMMAERKIVTPIANGQVLLFSCVSALYMYFFKFLVGSSELPPPLSPEGGTSSAQPIAASVHEGGVDATDDVSRRQRSPSPSATPSYKSSQVRHSVLRYLPRELQLLVHWWRAGSKHALCRHNHSCRADVVESFLRMFGVGYAVQAVLRLLRTLTKLFSRPRVLLEALTHADNFKLGAFLGVYVAVFKGMNCLLRWLRQQESASHGLLSGFLAGFSMMFWKSTTIAMYLTSKMAELLYYKGIERGVLPYIKFGEILVYTISTSIVFHAAVFEPHSLRPAYWKFLLQITNGRFAEMNRQLLEIYGTRASKLMPDFWPDYDPRYSSLTLDSVKALIAHANDAAGSG